MQFYGFIAELGAQTVSGCLEVGILIVGKGK